ncbi:glycyl-tRNA synthetase [Gilbertella persicaria]|uniref:glycyl-tRNA synthetase n=1 Tax=Gilbertella persicaria TaxID=101096 RepID=UPI00221FA687|nr:glycyl-tRNA synthetase [Gilbertella persicaria]KAI8051090.1 glycyl-tRNA synthetase [Gilbertella persicaria]
MAHQFRTLLDLCRRRGFLYQSAEIYGGLRGAYDYGPLGVELKKNILNSWWRRHVYYRDDVVGIDTSIITPHPVLKASGHVDEFTDLLVDCTLSKERFRPDKAPALTLDKRGRIPIAAPDKTTALAWKKKLEEQNIKITMEGKQLLLQPVHVVQPTLTQTGKIVLETTTQTPFEVAYHGYVEPNSNSPFLTDSRPFNLMFKTFLDPIDPIDKVIQTTLKEKDTTQVRHAVDQVLRPSTVYLRPETAQGVFVNFEQVVRTMKTKPPFGIAQVGKSFRNEIRLEHGIFRTPEFEQMELEYFVAPYESQQWFEYWRKERYQWWLEHACHPENFRQRDHGQHEMAHYATGCTDVEYNYPWGWGEVEGVAHRGNYDLTQHVQNTGANFYVEDPSLPEKKYMPHVVESSCGLNRAMLAYLCDAFHQVQEEKGARYVLKLHPRLAPIKCAVMPLTGKEEFNPLVQKVAKSLRRHGWYTVVESQKLKIGKRYYRHDEIGTPWCVTVDYQSLEDETVTVRDRDTGEQQRLHWKQIQRFIGDQLMEDM